MSNLSDGQTVGAAHPPGPAALLLFSPSGCTCRFPAEIWVDQKKETVSDKAIS